MQIVVKSFFCRKLRKERKFNLKVKVKRKNQIYTVPGTGLKELRYGTAMTAMTTKIMRIGDNDDDTVGMSTFRFFCDRTFRGFFVP